MSQSVDSDVLQRKKLLKERYEQVRMETERLVEPLEIEDFMVQSAIHISPPKWHLAHTTWFFEAFVLKPYQQYQVFDDNYEFILNSYYESLGDFLERDFRGVISRPSVQMIYDYRHYVDEQIMTLINNLRDTHKWAEVADLIELGLQHEQQHHEGLLADIKYNFWMNPFQPAYCAQVELPVELQERMSSKTEWIDFQEGLVHIGYNGEGFSFDNETPRHKYWLEAYRLSAQLVTQGDMLDFIEDGGYQHHEFWLSDGWDLIQEEKWKAPLYWKKVDNKWHVFTLSGLKQLNPVEPVSHVSFYEALAYAKWAKKRLPTEQEWENAIISRQLSVEGHFLEVGQYHPRPANIDNNGLAQMFGNVWEWTMSPYTPYPGSQPLQGAGSEYNHKFMFNKMVLKGGSCLTPQSHMRPTYRNYYPLDSRKPCAGFRLAEDCR